MSYLAFALRFIFPCAHLCLSSRDSFLRAAALNLRTGFDAWDCFAFAHRARWAAAILARSQFDQVGRPREVTRQMRGYFRHVRLAGGPAHTDYARIVG